MLTVMLSGYMRGAFDDVIDQNARFDTGHVKVMTKAYAENKDQIPNDLALLKVGALTESLQKDFPNMEWVKRIKFGGLIDVPDSEGTGIALDILSAGSSELKRMNIEQSLVSGRLPKAQGEALMSDDFAKKLQLALGDDLFW